MFKQYNEGFVSKDMKDTSNSNVCYTWNSENLENILLSSSKLEEN